MKPGTLLSSDQMLFRRAVGNAQHPDTGEVYELSATFAELSPIVRSKRTGKWFVLTWSDIVNLAVHAGIDSDDAQTVDTSAEQESPQA